MKKLVLLLTLVAVNLMAMGGSRYSVIGISLYGADRARNDLQFPDRNGCVYGWRLAFISGKNSRMIGLATAVFANDDAHGYVGGLQVASLLNTADDCELGVWQISGLYNQIARNCNGVQVSSFCNKVGGYFNGMQIGMCNEVKSDCAGFQVGLWNKAQSAWGAQIGLLNYATHLQGVQIGLLNFVESSQMTAFPIVRVGW